MKPFRIAFVGVDHPHGAGWRESVANLGDEALITAVVPCFGGTTYSLEERHHRAQRFDSVDALLGDGSNQFDAAIICLPNNESPAAATKLASAGKHILVEKPGAGSVEDVKQLIAAVQKSGVAFQSGYMWRYDDGANRLREMVVDGRFGKLISVEMSFVTSDVNRRGPGHYLFDPATSQRGFFNWLACHWLDLLLYITVDAITGVTARVGRFGATPVEVEDGGAVILDLASGGMATFLGGYWLPRWTGESQWTLRGSQRWVHWDPSRPGTGGMLTIHGPQPQFHAMEEVFTIPADKTPGYGGYRSVALLRDWIDAARSGKPCRNTAQSMVDVLELLDAIYRASSEARRVECRIGA